MATKKPTTKLKTRNKAKSRVKSPLTSFKLSPGVLAVVAGVLILIGGFWVLLSQAATPFRHPGVLVSKEQLDFVKGKIAAGQEPWLSSFNKMKSSSLASKTYTPKPVPKLMCSTSVGLNEGFPQAGCAEFNNDGAAAYTQALMYAYTGDVTYANNTAKIINAWSSTLKELPYDQPRTSNGEPAYWQNLLVVGWSTETMTRGAEIIRYTSNAMTPTQITQSENWFKNFIYPYLNSYTAGGNGNGGMTWTEAVMNIGIYTNDRAIYDKGVSWYRTKARQLIYLSSDGPKAPMPTDANTGKVWGWGTVDQHWRYPTKWVSGLETETCRDLGHTFMGLGPFSNVAETAAIQGTHDLYGENKNRFIAAYELNADFVNQMLDRMAASGQTAKQVTDSGWLPNNFPCSDFKDGGGSAYLGLELAYNHFVTRLGGSMPNTKRLIERTRPQNGGNHLFYEALTHANTGKVGLPVANTSSVSPSPTPTSTVTTSPVPTVPVETVTPSPSTTPSPTPTFTTTITPTTTSSPTPTPTVTTTPSTTPTPTVDVTKPSNPAAVKASLVFDPARFSYYSNLTWSPSYDNVGVTSYEVKRNGVSLGTSVTPNFKDYSPQPNILYTYDIYARDAAGNISAPGTARLTGRCFLIWCWSE